MGDFGAGCDEMPAWLVGVVLLLVGILLLIVLIAWFGADLSVFLTTPIQIGG